MKRINFKLIVLFTIFLIVNISSCRMAIQSLLGKKNDEEKNESVQLEMLTWSKASIDLKIGGMDNLLLTAKPENKRSEAIIVYEYNAEIINLIIDSRGVIVEGLKKGKTVLSAKNGKVTTNCIVTVSGYDENYEKEPYIYSASNIIQLLPGSQERVAVSLYGGSAEDSQNFSWKNEKDDVVEIAPNGQFCLINAKGEGNSKITITHPKASYPYSILVYNLPDAQKATYISTTENVITLQKNNGDKEISVAMQNPPDSFNPALFKWELIQNEGEVCSIDFNREKCVITPLSAGTALIKISHNAAPYPLEILVRVVELVKNVYIKPSETFVEISGDESKTISLKLEGYSEDYDVNKFSWSIPENEVINHNHYGNEIVVSGKKNGMVKISVSHPMAAYPRDIMVNVKNQALDAIDSSTYITTSQNYIRTKIGAEAIPLNILLVGGEAGDQNNFKWTLKHNPKIANNKVIKFETSHGQVFSRSTSISYEDGTGYITPISEGSAVIEITHPKALYPTEVLVKVLPSHAVLEEPFYFTGTPIVKLLNGTEQEVNINLHGKNKTEADNEKIKWETESTHISLTGNGQKALIRATGQGSHVSQIKVSHPRAEADKKIVVLSADTQEELDKMKALYAYKQSYKTKVGDTLVIQAEHTGFSDEEIKLFTWSSVTPDLVNCEPYIDSPSGETFYTLAKITGLKSGEAKVLLKSNSAGVPDLVFDITVLPQNANLEAEPDEAYLTTFQNVVSLKAKDESANVEITAVGLSSDKLSDISWIVETEGIVSINAQGDSAVFTGLKDGETIVIVSHPECQNKLKIHVRVGNKYIFNNNDKTIYISTDTDTILAVKDEPAKKITARLINYSDFTNEKFKFQIDKPDIASISQSDDSCLVKPTKAGQALITVSHPKSNFTKSVLVVVGNSKEELEGFSYLTTANNVITVTKGQSKNISVAVMNSPETIIDGYTWESKNPEVATANAVGANAVIHGNEIGTTRVIVSNNKCIYPLELIVICVDSSSAVLNPFISTSANVLNLKAEKGTSPWTTFAASLEGGSEFDQQNFSWQVEDSNIVQMFGQGATCKMRAIKAGTTRLIITHPKAEHPCYVLLICDEVKPNKCYISVPENIISMKPNQGEMAITASLVNGEIEDKYAFNFYADTYDVVELNYSANVASIKPIGQGQTTIHVTHPKAAFEQQIIVKVSEYTQFEFGMEYYKLTNGKTGYVSMRVPITSVPCHVEYESMNTNICMIEGTNKTAQITAIGAGNTKVKAKLVATKTNVVQATAEMLINIEESTEDLVYITTSKTVYSIEKGTTTTIAANITGQGIGTVDQQNLKWKSSDPSVIKLVGASTTGIATGPQCMLQALKAGECTVTISHDKCNTDLIIKIIVPGTDDVDISLNKTYIRLETGGRTEVKAKLTNAKPEDYKTIEWSIEEQNGNVIADVLGKGETVAVFARNVGKTVLHARLPNGKTAECDIVVEASRHISFASQEIVIEPGETKIIKYSVSPEDAGITWTTDSDAYFDYSVDEHTKTVKITGKLEGLGRLTGVTQYGNRTTLAVKCSWNYKFSIDKSIIKDEPKGQFVINYEVVPQDAKIEVTLLNNNTDFVKWTVDELQKKITLTPIKEGAGNLSITATNPRDADTIIGTRTCNLELLYKKVNILPKIINQKGIFSKIKNNNSVIVLGDGEELNIQLDFDKENADVNITGIVFEKKSNENEEANKIILERNENNKQFTLKHTHDKTVEVYKITRKPYLLYEGRKSYFNWIKKGNRYFLNVDLNDFADLHKVKPAQTIQTQENTPVFGGYERRKHKGIVYSVPTVKQIPATVYKDYSSYIVNFKGFFVKNDGIYSLFKSDSPLTLVTRKPKLHLREEQYQGPADWYSDELSELTFSEYLWDESSYETSLPQTINETTTEENPVMDKIRYETLNKTVYIDTGNEQKYPQYYIPQNDGSYELCTLNGGEEYNKIVITPDKVVTNEMQAGFIIVNYLHNNKQNSVKILVKVEERECNINCTEN